MLYELLTGKRPYKLEYASRGALEKAILRADPGRPSDAVVDTKLRRALSGDLDTIVLKALKKAAADRYPTVAALAEDIERHLQHRAVLAQPDSGTYRLRKFMLRNRRAVRAAAVVTASLLIGSSVALWQMFEAMAQRDNAVYQQQNARVTNEFLKQLLEDVGASGKPRTLAETLDRTIETLELQYDKNERVSARMMLEASIIVGTVGKKDRQLALIERVSASATRLSDADLLAEAECYAVPTLVNKDLAAAKARYARGREAQSRAARAGTEVMITCDRAEAWLLASGGDSAGATMAFERILERYGNEPAMSVGTRVSLLSDIGLLHYRADNTAGALVAMERASRLLDDAGRGRSMTKVLIMANMAAVMSRGGEVLAASQQQQAVIALLRQVESAGDLPPGYAGHLANSLLRLARYEEALKLAQEDAQRAHTAGNTRTGALSDLIAARALVKLGRYDAARELLAQAEAGLRVNAKANQRMLNEVELTRADGHLLRGELDASRRIVSAVLERLGYPERRDAPGLGSALFTSARVALAQGDAATAEQQAADGAVIAGRVARDKSQSADYGQASMHRALALAASGRFAEAAESAAQAHTLTRGRLRRGAPRGRRGRAPTGELARGRRTALIAGCAVR